MRFRNSFPGEVSSPIKHVRPSYDEVLPRRDPRWFQIHRRASLSNRYPRADRTGGFLYEQGLRSRGPCILHPDTVRRVRGMAPHRPVRGYGVRPVPRGTRLLLVRSGERQEDPGAREGPESRRSPRMARSVRGCLEEVHRPTHAFPTAGYLRSGLRGDVPAGLQSGSSEVFCKRL